MAVLVHASRSPSPIHLLHAQRHEHSTSPAVIVAAGWLQTVPLYAKCTLLLSGYLGNKFLNAAYESRLQRQAALDWIALPATAAHISTLLVMVQVLRSPVSPVRAIPLACLLWAGVSSGLAACEQLAPEIPTDPIDRLLGCFLDGKFGYPGWRILSVRSSRGCYIF